MSKPGVERPEPLPIPVLHANDKCRLAKMVAQPAGDNTDDAGVPAGAVDDGNRTAIVDFRRPRQSGLLDRRLDGAALGVVNVEFRGDTARLNRIVGAEQTRAGIGTADAATGIDARSQHESRKIGAGALLRPGNIGQCRKPEVGSPRHHFETL